MKRSGNMLWKGIPNFNWKTIPTDVLLKDFQGIYFTVDAIIKIIDQQRTDNKNKVIYDIVKKFKERSLVEQGTEKWLKSRSGFDNNASEIAMYLGIFRQPNYGLFLDKKNNPLYDNSNNIIKTRVFPQSQEPKSFIVSKEANMYAGTKSENTWKYIYLSYTKNFIERINKKLIEDKKTPIDQFFFFETGVWEFEWSKFPNKSIPEFFEEYKNGYRFVDFLFTKTEFDEKKFVNILPITLLPKIGVSPDGIVKIKIGNEIRTIAVEGKAKTFFLEDDDKKSNEVITIDNERIKVQEYKYKNFDMYPFSNIPSIYVLQVQLEMIVTGAPTCSFISYTKTHGMKMIEVLLNLTLLDSMFSSLCYMKGCVDRLKLQYIGKKEEKIDPLINQIYESLFKKSCYKILQSEIEKLQLKIKDGNKVQEIKNVEIKDMKHGMPMFPLNLENYKKFIEEMKNRYK
jgi:hypothetical protein